ncbi:MAG: dynamin family protein [Treponema sp.]|jgi:predicted GTPase|nr:dynamin family protein [Treponema sp.]
MKDNAFDQIEAAAQRVKDVHDTVQEVARTMQETLWFGNTGLMLDLQNLIDGLNRAYQELCHPCLKIAFVGTTSSGKSTLLNGLSGRRIAPIEAGEMSAGVVRIRNDTTLSMTVLETANMAWKAGSYDVQSDDEIYRALRDKESGIMERYWKANAKNTEVMAPQIEITAPLAPKNGGIPRFQMPPSLGLEFYDLPGLKNVTDSRNLQVIQKYLAGSFLVVVLNYSDTNSDTRKKLLLEIKQTVVSVCKNKEALVFVLNRIDERNSDDDPLEECIEGLRKDIQAALELNEAPLIIPMSALPLYHLQTAWGVEREPLYAKGQIEKSKEHLRKFFVDCAKIIASMRDESEEKDAWFNTHTKRNIDKEGVWNSNDVPQLLGWVYEYSRGYEFWKILQMKLDEQIGAIIINPAIGKTVNMLETFSGQLKGLLAILQLSTEEEIKKEKALIEVLAQDIKKKLEDFKAQFIWDFNESIEACRKRDLHAIENSRYATQFGEMQDILRKIRIDIYETVLTPIYNTLCDCDSDHLDALEQQLGEAVPRKLAHDVRRIVNDLVNKGYMAQYARNGFTIKCKESEKSRHTDELECMKSLKHICYSFFYPRLKELLIYRSKLLLQQQISFFEEKTKVILSGAMVQLFGDIKELIPNVQLESMLIPIQMQKTSEVTLPDNLFSLDEEQEGSILTEQESREVWEKIPKEIQEKIPREVWKKKPRVVWEKIPKSVWEKVPRKIVDKVARQECYDAGGSCSTDYRYRTVYDNVEKTVYDDVEKVIYNDVKKTVYDDVKEVVTDTVTKTVIEDRKKNITETVKYYHESLRSAGEMVKQWESGLELGEGELWNALGKAIGTIAADAMDEYAKSLADTESRILQTLDAQFDVLKQDKLAIVASADDCSRVITTQAEALSALQEYCLERGRDR